MACPRKQKRGLSTLLSIYPLGRQPAGRPLPGRYGPKFHLHGDAALGRQPRASVPDLALLVTDQGQARVPPPPRSCRRCRSRQITLTTMSRTDYESVATGTKRAVLNQKIQATPPPSPPLPLIASRNHSKQAYSFHPGRRGIVRQGLVFSNQGSG